MSESDEWVMLECGERLHRDTIAYRIDRLGWTAHAARTTPVEKSNGKSGHPNAASAFRAAEVPPQDGQHLMRTYGVSIEEAIDHLKPRHANG